MTNVSKTFAGRQVLRNVNLEFWPGTIHGLVGQNGSGKSTLVKILAGYHPPDAQSTLEIRGVPVSHGLRPDDPRKLGLAFVHQDLGLAENASVLENMRVGRYETGVGWRIRWGSERKRVANAFRRYGLDIAPDVAVRELREVDRALVAIVRALESVRELEDAALILDEPTVYLPRDHADHLFAAMREIANHGVAVVLVAHRLEEILDVTDRVTVLRNGELIETVETARTSKDQLIKLIVGLPIEKLYPSASSASGDVIFQAAGVAGAGVRGVNLYLRRGEILGLAGLLGSGYDAVPYLLFGAQRAEAGEIIVGGRTHELRALSPRTARRLGLALIPANRRLQGGVEEATLLENVTLATLKSYFEAGVLNGRRQRNRTAELVRKFDIRPPTPKARLATLSGGNQQKALFAKWLETRPSVLLLHEPAQGVDVGARRALFQAVRGAAQDGCGVILASSEHDDLGHLCDRVAIFHDGTIAAELQGDDVQPDRILEQCLRYG